ncbi:MAG: prepilin-type N-terminal cleavage/methylation domain-containing protein [Maricaulaceae bacterium]
MTAAGAGRADQAGFTLLEAIAAMALLADALIPLYALQASNLRAAVRLAEIDAAAAARANVVAFARALNPGVTPQGQFLLGQTAVTWRSQVLAQARETPRPGGWDVQYYQVVFTIDAPGAPLETLTVRKTGWRLGALRDELVANPSFRP